MKTRTFLIAALLCFALAGFGQENNDFYDNTPVKNLAGTLSVEVLGEVAAPGAVSLELLPRRSLIVREARMAKDGLSFVGSYRYDGYSLFDILKEMVVAKKNEAEFRSVIDLLVAVENAQGDKVILSWGEIFYPTALHRILIADRVSPIIPSETKENWPLPGAMRLVCGNDLVSERILESPTRITVFSAPVHPAGKKGQKPLFAPTFRVYAADGRAAAFSGVPAKAERRIFPSVFYGRGKGFHGIQRFGGFLLSEALKGSVTVDAATLRRGYLVAASVDGYRIAMSCSELFNRNDQADFLLLDRGEGSDGGRFAIFPAADFFSDRALKAVSAIHILTY
ncbi:MAG: hypothetical protein MUC72_07695 [Acidobacteria bacterium]|jgi:hypothetical protein|nr:hypothetical protein [Acidobacteriota bacterium]